jgi:gliding motility-associated-like protein
MIAVPRDVRVFAPNAFSPNGNGLNEDFVVEGVDWMTTSMQFDVFDRWGENIYTQSGGQPRWDGSLNGVPVKNDVYVWRLKIRQVCGYDEQTILRHVTVVR